MTQEQAFKAERHPDDNTFEGHQEEVFEAYFKSGKPVAIYQAEVDELDELLKDVDPEDIELVAIDDNGGGER